MADNKINVSQNLKFVSGKVENIVQKGENAVCQLFTKGINFGLDQTEGICKLNAAKCMICENKKRKRKKK